LAGFYGRQGKAFGGQASVTQALAGAQMTVVAEAGIEQRLAGPDVGGPLRADREGSGFPGGGKGRGLKSGHVASTLAPAAVARGVLGYLVCREGAGCAGSCSLLGSAREGTIEPSATSATLGWASDAQRLRCGRS